MWFAVHAILSIQKKETSLEPICAHENVFLVEAVDSETAEKIGADLGGEQAGEAGDTLEWAGAPARLKFEGIRKVIEIRSTSPRNLPIAGAEVTYNFLEFPSAKALKCFAEGKVASATQQE
jgi:hypothetical protein